MNPDKLFDYLDGKLAPGDRAQLEEKLMSDAQLRREFEMAREIHRSSRGGREVLQASEDPAAVARGGRLGRQIATAAFVLVVLNVFVGLAVIGWRSRKPAEDRTQEAAIRRQLEVSLGAAGKNALPVPTFVEDEIRLMAPRAEWDATAAKVIATAEKCGGTAAKGLPADDQVTVVADLPAARTQDFRELLAPPTSAAPAPDAITATPAPNERTIVQVRISEKAR